jgi:sortase family protein
MRFLVRVVRDRLVSAVLTAAGVTLLAAGLLHYGNPAQARPIGPTPAPSAVTASPTAAFVPPSLPPIDGSPGPSVPGPSADPNRVATRVVVDALGIDLPVIAQPNASYPSCNVAMYYQAEGLGQPGSGKSIYLYAHARDGMFGPLYERAILGRSGGSKSLLGMLVLVYTSDDRVYEYTVTGVRPRVKADSHFLDGPLAVKAETLWLQTSTGPNASYPKLQVVAQPFYVDVASHADAHPKARPVSC